ncbi:sel1 repeat family protein [Zooshikella marina]|uniref:tetratricopeptide repeat protein n=1 Tax=Zooshikella ganghwensis TaxID=202772 RepID=UPI001BB024FA|nr:tetratricopeptide repeat protein [Zooshikella ganghwensis]MBU2709194.1 sel1 repeat family protein [Zooshikella ganghwensis]
MNTTYDAMLDKAKAAYESNDTETAIALFTYLAQKGVAKACQYLGVIYSYGDGVLNTEARGKKWQKMLIDILQRRADDGDIDAMYELAKHYLHGEFVIRNGNKAKSLFFNAANRHHAGAQFQLAMLYKVGTNSCPADHDLYRYWLMKAAYNLQAEAMYYYGLELMRSNKKQASEWFIQEARMKGFWLADFV